MNLKPLDEQVMVITGASSGIGLATAQEAAKRGVSLVLAARAEDALREVSERLREDGVEAIAVECDVADVAQVKRVADVAVERFGRFDSWVNNAGVSVFGRLTQVDPADHRRLFETNFWGTVNGSLAAAREFAKRGPDAPAGTIINVGSVLSDRAIPLQGMYSATKHAVKGFTDALRMELEKDGVPASVTLVKPSAIATPYAENAKNYMGHAATLPPPAYAPEVVADVILHAARVPTREIMAGGGGIGFSLLGAVAPGLTDKLMEWGVFDAQQKDAAPRPGPDGLRQASGRGQTRGDYEGHVRRTSLWNFAQKHPAATAAAAVGVGLAVGAGLFAAGRDD